MMGGRMKRKMLNKLLKSSAIDNLTAALASVENELLQTAVDLERATDVEHVSGEELPTIEDRQEALKDLVAALANDGMEDVFVTQIAPQEFDNADRLREYVDMDAEEWDDQVSAWAETYREQGASGSDRTLAEHHVRETFGVDLDRFEQRVVEFEPGEEAERVFAGNLRAVRESMRQATEAARGAE